MKNFTKIHNLPSIPPDFKYIVARRFDDKLWYYGAYKTRQKAKEVADELNKLDCFTKAYVIGGYNE